MSESTKRAASIYGTKVSQPRLIGNTKSTKPTGGTKLAKKSLSKGAYGKLIGVGPHQRSAKPDPSLKKIDPETNVVSKNYDAFGEVELGWSKDRVFEENGVARQKENVASENKNEDGTDTNDVELKKPTTIYHPTVKFSSNAKYRTVTNDGSYITAPDLTVPPPKPGSAADKIAHPPPPMKSTGDERLDKKRLRKKMELERAAEEVERNKSIAQKRRQEKHASKKSIEGAELAFFKNTVWNMSEKFNKLKVKNDAKERVLSKLVTTFATIDIKFVAQRQDKADLRGGGGVAGAGKVMSVNYPSSDLGYNELKQQVLEAERLALEEREKTEQLGHLILRIKDFDPTSEEARLEPFKTLTTTRETAIAAATEALSVTSKATVPWVTRKLELVKKYQDEVEESIATENARNVTARNEEHQARDMLARTMHSVQEKRESYDVQLSQRKMELLSLKAQDEATAERKKSFIANLVKMNAQIAEEEANRKRGGKQALSGFSGGLAKAFLYAMTGGALRGKEAKIDAAIRRIITVIPDITPEGLVEGFKTRKQRKQLTKNVASKRQEEHDLLQKKRDVLLQKLTDTKNVLYNADGWEDKTVERRASRAERPGEGSGDKVFLFEHHAHQARLMLGDKEKQLASLATGVLNLSENVTSFSETLSATLPDWEGAMREARAEMGPEGEGEEVEDDTKEEESEKTESDDAKNAESEEKKDESSAAASVEDDVEPSVAVKPPSLDLMNQTARDGITTLLLFTEVLEKTNVIAQADVHKERATQAAVEQGVHPSRVILSSHDPEWKEGNTSPPVNSVIAKLRKEELGFGKEKTKGLSRNPSMQSLSSVGTGDVKIVRQMSSHNLRVGLGMGNQSDDDDDDDDDDDTGTVGKETDPRVSQKLSSVTLFRANQKKGLENKWAKDVETAIDKPKGGRLVKKKVIKEKPKTAVTGGEGDNETAVDV